ncbi:hypothetical protein [Pengzhenrongella sicca]|uniref:Uncharacterized protein n=1 Tax=Pengzhenrongella sicca TaxID=2819238 RepID=A0A8A4ZLU3_9MICO|nr:hypothetical protein [Pengzhenrongella sicca]QTE30538.1 hypothetical protein J4E96_06060 [Pengzhenrongella sicca]
MISLLVWTFVALAAAAIVMIVAGVNSGPSGGARGFIRDLRAGLATWRGRGTAAPAEVVSDEPVDATFDEFFAAAEVDDEPYLQLDDLTDTLTWARDHASRATRAGRDAASRSANLVRR